MLDRCVRLANASLHHLSERWRATGAVVGRWHNVRRDLTIACQRAGIRPVSPNDLRRTFASWLKQRGVDSMVVPRRRVGAGPVSAAVGTSTATAYSTWPWQIRGPIAYR